MRIDWKSLDRDQRIELLKAGIERGLSAQQIADEIDGCTKNAIIGLSFKTGIKLAAKKPGPRKKGKPAAPKSGMTFRPLRPIKTVKMRKRPKAPKPVEIEKPAWSTATLAEREAIVRAGLAVNLTRKEIADRFADATPKAVKSFIERMRARDMFAAQPKQEAATTAAPVVMPPPVEPAPAIEPEATAAAKKGVNILDIQSGQCRFPIWEDQPRRPLRSPDDWNYCGEPVQTGSSYCPRCHGKVWVKPEKPIRFDRRHMK
jgi:hypothetical protein